MSESTTASCCCTLTIPGTQAPLAPYVVSIGGLQGIIELNGTGVIDISTSGNTINFGLSAGAGLGTVTSVAASSSSSNLVVGGSPINTFGTLTFALAGNIGSIAGLVMAADQMTYSTGPGVFVATGLTTFGRSLIDDANAAAAQTTLGLLIGTNVQAWSADLDSFVTVASFVGPALSLSNNLTVGSDLSVGGDFSVTGTSTVNGLTAGGNITAAFFIGDGSLLTSLNATQLTTGTTAVARGGTGIASYAIGDLLYASGATTLAKLPDVAAGSYLRSGGVTTAPVWSTLTLPNTATTGDIFYASGANVMGRLADVATTNVLLSGGVGVAPAWGKVTLSHTTGIAKNGTNNDINEFTSDIVFSGSVVDFSGSAGFAGQILDGSSVPGNANDILTSTSTGVLWSNQIILSTLQVDGLVYLEGTITAAGSTGAKTINKQAGTVRFAAGAGTLIITNSLALAASTRALATVCSVDTTLKSVAAVVTDGFITLTGNGNANSETEVYWELRGIV